MGLKHSRLTGVLVLTVFGLFASFPAFAGVPIPIARPVAPAAPELTPVTIAQADWAAAPALPAIVPDTAAVAGDDAAGVTPSIVTPSHWLYCVAFARALTGIDIRGDAKTWWDSARGLYAELAYPLPGAVMVFAGSPTLRHGHLAVVKQIVSAREIVVDHANWLNDGRIYLNAPVKDVSNANDWSLVKVWNTRLGQWGSRAYRIKGFVSG